MDLYRLLLPVLFLLLSVEGVAAQDFYTTAPNPGVPSPSEYLGYSPGEEYTFHAQIVGYLYALSDASDRVTIHRYGETHQRRPLYYAVITSPENHARMEDIRRRNLALSRPDSVSSAEMDRILADQPVITWLSYGVHGNETSSSEAALQTLYHLVSGSDAETLRILDDSVVIIDPVMNPDGRDRYVYWYRSVQRRVLSTDTDDLEHDEPWPGGRTNHYWFDLNRDWAWLVHPESQARIAAYQEWLPQVHVDYHEMGFNRNYFTAPPATPRNLLVPAGFMDWADVFGRAKNRELDRVRQSYFTSETFDFFYPGYGDTYPSMLGAIGMLTEQGGGTAAGRAVETEDGYVLTLEQRVMNHYLTSVATARTAADNRSGLLQYFRDFFVSPSGPHKTYVIADAEHGYSRDVVSLLLRHGLRVDRALASFSAGAARAYWNGRPERRTFEAGTFLVTTDQPRHVFVETLLERGLAIEDSVMYDISTWSLPIAYNLDAAIVEGPINVQRVPVTAAPEWRGEVVNPNASYAFVIDWRQRMAPHALAELWKAGYSVRIAQRPFSAGGHTFERGSVILLAGRNPAGGESLAGDMQRIARAAGVRIVGLDSGRAQDGIDLSSPQTFSARQPKVALLVDRPFNALSAGQLWYLFDYHTGLPVNRIRSARLPDINLHEYDVLIIPGVAGDLSSVLDSAQVARIHEWVRSGGTLVATENSAAFFAKDRPGNTSVPLVARSSEDSNASEPEDPYMSHEERVRQRGLDRIPGSAFQAHVDATHPLGYGMPPTFYSLKSSTDAFEPSADYDLVAHYGTDNAEVLVSGYASQQNVEKLAGKAFAAVERSSRGKYVLLLDSTHYRMFWLGPMRMMQNAVMLMPGA